MRPTRADSLQPQKLISVHLRINTIFIYTCTYATLHGYTYTLRAHLYGNNDTFLFPLWVYLSYALVRISHASVCNPLRPIFYF